MKTKFYLPQPILYSIDQNIECIELSVNSITELYEHLNNLCPDLVHEMFEQCGKLKSTIMVMVNDKHIVNEELDKLKINSGDDVYLLNQFAGG